MNWISIDDELPPRDGEYQARRNKLPEKEILSSMQQYIRTYFYDGIGFKAPNGEYKHVKYWRIPPVPTKKYGKI